MAESGIIAVKGKYFSIKRTYPFRIAWMPDIHVGAQMGLFPKEFIPRGGNPMGPNAGQIILRGYMYEFAAECKENKVNILALPGDLVTGQNPREKGKYVINIEMNDQTKACAQVIAEFCSLVPSIEEVWIWKGTGYHGAEQMSVEESIVKNLKEDYKIKARYFGEYSFIKLKYKDREKTLFVAHSASAAYMYPEQAMGRDMMMFQESEAQGKLPHVDMIVRAHKHSFIEVHKPSIRSLQLPCFQLFVPYDGAVKMYPRYQPDIGGVIMLLDHKLRTTVWHFTYPNVMDPLKDLTVVHGLNKFKVGRKFKDGIAVGDRKDAKTDDELLLRE